MFEAEKMLKMVLTQANVINERWQGLGIKMVTTQTKIDSYLSLKRALEQQNLHKKSEKSERLSTL